MQVSVSAHHLTIARNFCARCARIIGPQGGSVAVNITDANKGSNHIAFNVVDLTELRLQCRRTNVTGVVECGTSSNRLFGPGRVPLWSKNSLVAQHGGIGDQSWKIYHNTVIQGKSREIGGLLWTHPSFLNKQDPWYIFNNLIVQIDDAEHNRCTSYSVFN